MLKFDQIANWIAELKRGDYNNLVMSGAMDLEFIYTSAVYITFDTIVPQSASTCRNFGVF